MADINFSQITTPGGYQPGSGIEGSTSAVEKLISNVLVVFTIVGGIAFALYFLLGGLNWVTAGGDKGKIDKAKSMMTGGATGIIVITVSYAITFIVSKALGLDILNPGTIINGIQVN
jgi:cytochrome bd-type quinol oxidase subunit 2